MVSRALLRAVLVILSIATSAQAATWLVPEDREMIQAADDIVIATASGSHFERGPRGGIVTRYVLRVEDVLKGTLAAGQNLVLIERGGIAGNTIQFIPGTPVYEPGQRYLVFAQMNAAGDRSTFGMALGQFLLREDDGVALALRAGIHGLDPNLEPYEERTREAAPFLSYIRALARGRAPASEDYWSKRERSLDVVAPDWVVQANFTRGSFLLEDEGSYFRWRDSGPGCPGCDGPRAAFVKSGTQLPPANPDTGVNKAMAQWNGTASDIELEDGGRDDSALGGVTVDDGKNAILFGDPNNEAQNARAAGVGGITKASGPYILDGESFWQMEEVDVVLADANLAQSCLNTLLAHELGHTLGFRHSNKPPPGGARTSDAIMNSAISCSWDGVLRGYDKEAAATVYGAGLPCTPPSIIKSPQSETIEAGASVSLSVTAGGTSPFSYQWYLGSAGDASKPVGNGSPSFLLREPVATTQVWVSVANSCGTIASRTATITVNVCQPPSIIGILPAVQNIRSGMTAAIAVSAAGNAPLRYQWFQGERGDTTHSVGTDSAQFTSSPLLRDTKFWVRVSGSCGPIADSNAVLVQVQSSRRRAVR